MGRAENITWMVTMMWAFLLLSCLSLQTVVAADAPSPLSQKAIIDLPPIANSAQTQNPNVVPPDAKEGGTEQWKSCAQLLHPEGSYPVSEIQAMFESPQNIPQLLHNLKIAADRGLLLQPAFYDEATLLKFFHGTKVTLADQKVYMEQLSSGIEARIESDISPKLSIILSRVCRVQKYNADDDTPGESVSSDGFLTIGIAPDSLTTLRDIRSVFGLENQLHMAGEDPDFPGYLGSDKGSAMYENAHRPGVNDSRIQTRFFFRKNHVDSIGDSDVVKKVEMHDLQDHFYRAPMDNSTHTQNATAVPPDKQGGGVEQWKACALQLHPEGSYAVSEIQAMFESPQNIPQFLHNLKIAADRRLVLQPSFYDEATLLKFFNGSKVTVARLNSYLDKQSSGIDARIASDTLPTLAIHLSSICTVRKATGMTHGSAIGSVDANGSLDITVIPGPLITLRDIRSAFGPEQGLSIDQGMDLDMNSYTPVYKGRVEYWAGLAPGISGIRIQIYFRKDGQRNWIGGSDVVKRLEMHDIQDHLLENR